MLKAPSVRIITEPRELSSAQKCEPASSGLSNPRTNPLFTVLNEAIQPPPEQDEEGVGSIIRTTSSSTPGPAQKTLEPKWAGSEAVFIATHSVLATETTSEHKIMTFGGIWRIHPYETIELDGYLYSAQNISINKNINGVFSTVVKFARVVFYQDTSEARDNFMQFADEQMKKHAKEKISRAIRPRMVRPGPWKVTK